MHIKKIGILDFGIRSLEYFNSEMSLRIIKEAILAEKLGFSRVWYAEHYDSIYTCWKSADIIVTLVAAYTDTIKVGIAGTLIQYYQPLKIAADYTMLASMFPDRIDLGFAKGKATGDYEKLLTMHQGPLETDRNELIKEKIKLSINFFNEEENNFYNNIVLPPLKGSKPHLWNLVGSLDGYLQSLNFVINC